MSDWSRRLQRLRELDSMDKERQLFGAQEHRYQLRPPLGEAEVCRLEARYQVRLPEEYRLYLTQFSNGGAGPAYGIFPAEWVAFDEASWRDSSVVGSIDRPFRFTSAWSLPGEHPDERTMDVALREVAAKKKAALAEVGLFLREPSGRVCGKNPYTGEDLIETESVLLQNRLGERDVMDGAIPIGDRGCGILDFLVVTGPERDHIWRWEDFRIFPVETASAPRLGLGAWFDAWLDDSLQKFAPPGG